MTDKKKLGRKPVKRYIDQKGGNKKLLSKEFLVLYERELVNTAKRKQKYQLRVCSWNGGPPVLEKRLLAYQFDLDTYFPYKQMGLNLEDFKIIMDNLPEIMSALNRPGEKVPDEEQPTNKIKD